MSTTNMMPGTTTPRRTSAAGRRRSTTRIFIVVAVIWMLLSTTILIQKLLMDQPLNVYTNNDITTGVVVLPPNNDDNNNAAVVSTTTTNHSHPQVPVNPSHPHPHDDDTAVSSSHQLDDDVNANALIMAAAAARKDSYAAAATNKAVVIVDVENDPKKKNQRNNMKKNPIDTICESLVVDNQKMNTSSTTDYFAFHDLLPPSQYPLIHKSCFFIQTNNIRLHKHLLRMYPNSWIVISKPLTDSTPSIDPITRIITLDGIDSYDLLWMKSKQMFDFVSAAQQQQQQQQQHYSDDGVLFQNCDWFFKVDTDTFVNLHMLEQILNSYTTTTTALPSSSDYHYIGMFGNGQGRTILNYYNYDGGGDGDNVGINTTTTPSRRKARGKVKLTVHIAIGGFYGMNKQIIEKWQEFQSRKRHVWKRKQGEDTQIAFFLRRNNICYDFPFRDKLKFQELSTGPSKTLKKSGGFNNHIEPITKCHKLIEKFINNPCWVWTHKVPLEWMSTLSSVMASHVIKKTKCDLIDYEFGGTRMVNGTAYHRRLPQKSSNMNTTTATTSTVGCDKQQSCDDPCLMDDESGCCVWVPAAAS